MKLPLSFCLALCFTSASCERHAELQREITTLSAAYKQDDEAIRQYEKDIAALGGNDAQNRIAAETQMKQDKLRPLEFENPPRERKWSAIETEFARLKPAAEAFKAAQLK